MLPIFFLFILTFPCSCHKHNTGNHDGATSEEALTAVVVTPARNSIALQGQTVVFKGSAAGGSEPYSYSWSLDGETIYSTDNPLNLRCDELGAYAVTLIAKDALGATASFTASIQVRPFENIECSFISAGMKHTLAIVPETVLRTWGYNFSGELGDGTWIDTNIPVKVLSDNQFTCVSAGDYTSIAINEDGTLWAWGVVYIPAVFSWNKKNTPIMINPDTDWRSISSGVQGNNYLLAIKNDNSLWKWDASVNGMVKMNRELDWRMVSNGLEHACAVKTNGTLWVWGNNTYGQLGIGNLNSWSIPVKLEKDKPWLAASSGGRHTVALLADGTVWTWGDNTFGQLGNESYTSSKVPVQMGIENDWVVVVAGLNHSMALKSNGTLWAWGDNYYGQLGDGTFLTSNKPVQVKSDIPWAAINSRYDHVIALKSDGTYWTWGANRAGQAGNGTLSDVGAPVMVEF